MASCAVEKWPNIVLQANTDDNTDFTFTPTWPRWPRVMAMGDGRLFIGVTNRIFFTSVITASMLSRTPAINVWKCQGNAVVSGYDCGDIITDIVFVRGGARFFVIEINKYSVYDTHDFVAAALTRGIRRVKPLATYTKIHTRRLTVNPRFPTNFAMRDIVFLIEGHLDGSGNELKLCHVKHERLCIVYAIEFTEGGNLLVGMSEGCIRLFDSKFKEIQLFFRPDCATRVVDRIVRLKLGNFILQYSNYDREGMVSARRIKACRLIEKGKGTDCHWKDIDGFELGRHWKDSYLICNIPGFKDLSFFCFKTGEGMIIRSDFHVAVVCHIPKMDSLPKSITSISHSIGLAFVLILNGDGVLQCYQIKDQPKKKKAIPAPGKDGKSPNKTAEEVGKNKLRKKIKQLVEENQYLMARVQLLEENKVLLDANNLRLEVENKRLKERILRLKS